MGIQAFQEAPFEFRSSLDMVNGGYIRTTVGPNVDVISMPSTIIGLKVPTIQYRFCIFEEQNTVIMSPHNGSRKSGVRLTVDLLAEGRFRCNSGV